MVPPKSGVGKPAEGALCENEERYRNLFESSHDALMTLDPPLWRFTSGNPSSVRMFMARDEAEFISKDPWELSPEYQPDGRKSADKAREMIDTAMRNGTHFFEWTHRRLNGEDFPATVLLSRMEFSGNVSLQATVRDITGQKRVEEALRESEKRYRTLAESIPDQIFILGRDDIMQYANAAALKLFQWPADRVIGIPRRNLFPPNIADGQDILLSRVFKTGEPVHTEEKIRFGTQEFWIDTNLVPLKDGAGNVTAVLGISRDITEHKLADDQLKNAEERYRLLIAHSPDIITVLSPEGKFRYNSPSLTPVLGYKHPEIENTEVLALIHPEDCSKVSETILLVMEKASDTIRAEFRIRHRDGSWRWLESRVRSAPLPGYGQVLIVNSRDITEQKEAEAAVAESEQRFRALFDSARDGMLVADNETHRFVMANAAILEQTGYTEGEMLGLSIDKIHPPKDLQYVIGQFEKQIRGEIPVAYDIPMLRKDRSVYFVDINSSDVPLNGRHYLLGVFRDVTERKRAEEKIREGRDKLQRIFASLPIGMHFYELMPDGRLTFTGANPAADTMLKIDHASLIGKTLEDAFPPLVGTRLPAQYRKVAANGKAWHAEEIRYTDEPMKGIYEVWVFQISPGKAAACFLDISERKAAEEKLRFLLREKEILLREVHHRVGNIIQLAVSMMKMEVRRENDKRVREVILITQIRLNAIASTFEKIYYSENMSRVNFQKVVGSIITSLRSEYGTEDRTIQSDIRIDIQDLGVDLALPLALITSELVNNALRHAFPEGRCGTITITGSDDGRGLITLIVSDDGVGLPVDINPAEPDSIGFTLVHILVQQVGGTWRYTSSDEGTTFSLEIPRTRNFDKTGGYADTGT